MKKLFLIVTIVLMAFGAVFVSCESGSEKFPGFKETDDGLCYQFHTKGTDTASPKMIPKT